MFAVPSRNLTRSSPSIRNEGGPQGPHSILKIAQFGKAVAVLNLIKCSSWKLIEGQKWNSFRWNMERAAALFLILPTFDNKFLYNANPFCMWICIERAYGCALINYMLKLIENNFRCIGCTYLVNYLFSGAIGNWGVHFSFFCVPARRTSILRGITLSSLLIAVSELVRCD